MALMRLLEAKGVLGFVARLLTPVLRPFGVPGVGVFAMLQMLLVSYAAPATTLSWMEEKGVPNRGLAATLAMVLALSQANASFPLVAVGLSLPLVLLSSLVGGLVAAAATHYLFLRTEEALPESHADKEKKAKEEEAKKRKEEEDRRAHWVSLLIEGGEQGVRLSLHAIPALLLALVVLNALGEAGAIPFLERSLSPVMATLGLPGVAVLPFLTKYLAGGTAMLGVVTDLIEGGAMTATDLNRLAGMMINPLDLVGLAVLCPPKTRLAAVARPAIAGAVVGIAVRAVLHLLLG